MKSLLKAVLSAAAFGAVVAGAVIIYVDHKIDQMTEAAIAPVVETRERVEKAIEEVEQSVSWVIDTGAETVDEVADTVDEFSTTVDSTLTTTSGRVEAFGEDVGAFVQSSADQTEQKIGEGADAVQEFWDRTTAGISETLGS